MAFTADEILSISEILEITPDQVTSHLTYLGELITAETETRVRAKISDWANVAGKFTRFKAKESNQGFEMDPAERKAAIRRTISGWLEFKDMVTRDPFLIEVERG